jgi:hypothetical protein
MDKRTASIQWIDLVSFQQEYQRQQSGNGCAFFQNLGIHIGNSEISKHSTDIKNTVFKNCQFHYVWIAPLKGNEGTDNKSRNLNIRDVLFMSCNFYDTVIYAANMNNVRFNDCSFNNNCHIDYSNIEKLKMRKTQLAVSRQLFGNCSFDVFPNPKRSIQIRSGRLLGIPSVSEEHGLVGSPTIGGKLIPNPHFTESGDWNKFVHPSGSDCYSVSNSPLFDEGLMRLCKENDKVT